MVVSEPSLMGGEFGDEDERMISRLENTQYDPTAAAAQVGLGVGMGGPGPSTSLGGPMGVPLPTSGGGLMGLQAMTQDPSKSPCLPSKGQGVFSLVKITPVGSDFVKFILGGNSYPAF